MQPTYTGRKDIWRDGRDHYAEITVRAGPGEPPSQVILSQKVLAELRTMFGADFEYQRHDIWAAVIVQIDTANVAGELPHVGAASFHAEVVGFRCSEGAEREVAGFLLTVAGMEAIGDYLSDWENAQMDNLTPPLR